MQSGDPKAHRGRDLTAPLLFVHLLNETTRLELNEDVPDHSPCCLAVVLRACAASLERLPEQLAQAANSEPLSLVHLAADRSCTATARWPRYAHANVLYLDEDVFNMALH